LQTFQNDSKFERNLEGGYYISSELCQNVYKNGYNISLTSLTLQVKISQMQFYNYYYTCRKGMSLFRSMQVYNYTCTVTESVNLGVMQFYNCSNTYSWKKGRFSLIQFYNYTLV